jgi:hypothetical protein
MRIDTRGVELTPPADWIKEKGEYTFKITKWEQDGYTDAGDEKFKLFMQTADGKLHSERFSTAPNMLWKIKRLEIALEAPEVYELDAIIGRYVTAEIGMREYNGKEYAEVKEWKYAKQNDKLDPIPSADMVEEEIPEKTKIPEIDIDEDEIPF